jgi:hypothetical protein
MARGGYGTGGGIPLRDRVRPSAAGDPVDGLSAPCIARHPARHCWVVAPVDTTAARPGLLLEWRKVDRRWEGRVVYLAELRPGRWSTVEEWIPGELLTGVD